MSDEWSKYDDMAEQAREEIEELQMAIDKVIKFANDTLAEFNNTSTDNEEFESMLACMAEVIGDWAHPIAQEIKSECPEQDGLLTVDETMDRFRKDRNEADIKTLQMAALNPLVSESFINDFFKHAGGSNE